MRAMILALVACAKPPQPAAPQSVAIVVQWKVEAGDGDRVNVTLVVDGTPLVIGALASTTNDAAGPSTCAVRSAPLRTELVCGDANYYAADLIASELVITFVDGLTKSEVKRVPVTGDALAVKALVL